MPLPCPALLRAVHASRVWLLLSLCWACGVPARSAEEQPAAWCQALLAARGELAGVEAHFPAYSSGLLRRETPPQKVVVPLKGVTQLWLVVEDADPRSRRGAAAWGDARLIAADGTAVPLASLQPAQRVPADLAFRVNRNDRDKPLRIGTRDFAAGLWMASGALGYKLDRPYVRLEAQVGVDSGRPNHIRVRVLNHPDFLVWRKLELEFPLCCDWFLQDLAACGLPCSWRTWDLRTYPARWFSAAADADVEARLIEKVLEELGPAGAAVRADLDKLRQANTAPHSGPWLELYIRACQLRRTARLETLTKLCPAFVFTKHANLGGSHYAYTEAQSDAQAERHFNPGSALCLLEMQPNGPRVRTLLEDPRGMIRDPDVSYDGRRVLFAWKKSDRLDDFHLYEMKLATGTLRQLTFGLGLADYEGAYLPGGDIVFNSTRCVQTVDCFTTEVSNLYTCDADGRQIRRLCYDQVHTNFPTVTGDGRVLYTRWEYNDRGQIYPQALFQMNADGTAQAEFYGNNSWFPTTILHARNIPGTQQVLAIATGHHSRQVGKLLMLDPTRGRQENEGAQLIAPVRPTPAVRVDGFGQDGDLFQYPYPLSATEYLVTYAPHGWGDLPHPVETGCDGRAPLFGVYYMTIDGRRELLASDPLVSCNQPMPLRRPAPRQRPNLVDPAHTTGTYYLQDIYAGPGLAGVARGTVKRLRVVALDFRAALLGGNGNAGVAGGAFVSTPVAVGNGCWDPKIVLGETPVADDGSAHFVIPARTPVYFQAIDAQGYVVQTMRSWSTLQPGETAACVGCHESKNCAPLAYRPATGQRQSPRPLEPFYGPPRGFSFAKEIQPLLDRHCIRCHNDRAQRPDFAATDKPAPAAKAEPPAVGGNPRSFSLLGEEVIDPAAKRRWSDAYLALTSARLENRRGAYHGQSCEMVNWVSPQSAPPMLPPYTAGAATSRLLRLLVAGHYDARLSREELDKLACWIDLVIPFGGDYYEAHAWTPEELARYEHFAAKRRQVAEGQPTGGDSPSPAELLLEVLDKDNAVIARQAGKATSTRPLALELPRRFQPGDRLHFQGAKHVALQIDAQLGERLLYVPGGDAVLPLPVNSGDAKPRSIPYPPHAFGVPQPRISLRPTTVRELDAYRNLACNPYDVGSAAAAPAFPHATSNSECRHEAVFAARNAIDGFTENRRHGGWPYQSWGPEKQSDVWWQVDFGRPVEVDKLVVTLRADFPHDRHWRQATLVFSDGSRRTINLEQSAAAQAFVFPVQTTSSIRLVDLKQDEPLGWCALAEVEAWGRDAIPVAANLAAHGD